MDGNTSLYPKNGLRFQIFFRVGFHYMYFLQCLQHYFGMRELFTFVACQMLNFVYKLAIRVYKSENIAFFMVNIQNNSIEQMLRRKF